MSAERSRKGFYFSFDAMIAVSLMFFGFLMFTTMEMNPNPLETRSSGFKRAAGVGQDSLEVMSRQNFGSLNESRTQALLNNSVLTEEDLNESVLDVISLLWASDNYTQAENLSKYYMDPLMPEKYNYRLRIYDGEDKVIYESSPFDDDAKIVTEASRMVSGYKKDMPTEGYVSKASLYEITKKDSEYFYFGGYEGDGRIEKRVSLPEFREISNFSLELDVRNDFNLYLNGHDLGQYTAFGENMSAEVFRICSKDYQTDKCSNFEPGENIIRLKFLGDKEFVAGGFGRINYEVSEASFSPKEKVEYYNFPYIDGAINIYSSFYVPGNLKGIEGRLHYNTNGTIFLNLGNATVYQNDTQGEVNISLDNNSIFSSLEESNMSYGWASRRTIPLRVGLKEIGQERYRPIIDSVSVIDISGSMDGSKIDEAKEAAKIFTNVILNITGNRVGMVSYESVIDTVHQLSMDNESVISTIDSLDAYGGTCIGCGILESIEVLDEPKSEYLIPRKSQWNYNISFPDSEPPLKEDENWTELYYNDSSWNNGSAILGFGENFDTEIEDNKGDYYFRKTFDYDEYKYKGIKGFIRADDSTNVYINGKLVDNDTEKHDGKYWNRRINGINPFWSDQFERDSTGTDWTVTSGAEGDEVKIGSSCGSSEGSNSMMLRWGAAVVESREFDLSEYSAASISYDLKQGGGGSCESPESGEDISIEYLDSSGDWKVLKNHLGGGNNPSAGSWGSYEVDIPLEGLHPNFKLRAYYPHGSGSDYDYWALDNVKIGYKVSFDDSILNDGRNVVAVRLKNEPAEESWITDSNLEWEVGDFTDTIAEEGKLVLKKNTVFSEGFEDGNLGSWSCTGSCGMSTSCAEIGNYAAYHRADSGSVISPEIDLSPYSGANISYWVKKGDDSCSEDPDGNEDFYVEYYDETGSWEQIDYFDCGSYPDGASMESEKFLPYDALHSDFKIRFRQTSGSGWYYDYWHFDEVKIESTGGGETEGSYLSEVFDAGQDVEWEDNYVTKNVPTSSNFSIDYSDTSDWYDSIESVPESRYLRYNISLSTDDPSADLNVDKVNITYRKHIGEFDLELNGSMRRNKSMVVMSDGEANRDTSMSDVPDHDGDGDVDAKDHTIEAGCRAGNQGITVYAVGFGTGADEETLNLTAQCGGGKYFFSSTGELEDIFRNISESLLKLSFVEQETEIKGDIQSELFSDSYLAFNYTDSQSLKIGKFSLTQQTDRFGGNITSPKNFSFEIPDNTEVVNAKATSYSGNYWTYLLQAENSSGEFETLYNLSKYNKEFLSLGDPYYLYIPPENLFVGEENKIKMDTAIGFGERRGGSPDNRVIYKILVDGTVGYNETFPTASGGKVTVKSDIQDFDISVKNSDLICNFNNTHYVPNSYETNDSVCNAINRLAKQLDLDQNNKIDFKLDTDNLKIADRSVGGVPWMWGPVNVIVEVWKE